MEKDELRACPQDKYPQLLLIYEDENGNVFGYWRVVLAYVDWLGNPAGLEDFKKQLLSRGITQQEIDDTISSFVQNIVVRYSRKILPKD